MQLEGDWSEVTSSGEEGNSVCGPIDVWTVVMCPESIVSICKIRQCASSFAVISDKKCDIQW